MAFAFGRIFSSKAYAFLLAAPTHNNLGDHMISLGTKKWCLDFLPEYIYKEFDDDIYKDWSHFDLFHLAVRKRDLILLRGGGSIGNRYLGYELFIRRVLETLTDNRVFIFPQSLYFSENEDGLYQEKLTASAYDGHPHLTLCLRDEESYLQAQKIFSKTRIHLCPDMALYLLDFVKGYDGPRRGVFLCLRQDGEKHFQNLAESLSETLLSLGYEINLGDTAAKGRVYQSTRAAVVEGFLSSLAQYQAIVTDRFHGLIAAVLTGTPAVVLKSEGHKIPSGIKWFDGCELVFYAESAEEVPALLEKTLTREGGGPPNFSDHFINLRELVVNDRTHP